MMETLVVVAQHNRNHYYNKNRAHSDSMRFGPFGSPPSGGFRDINCRTFQSGSGILPFPINNSCTTPVDNRSASGSFSAKTPSASIVSRVSRSEDQKNLKRSARSSAVMIPVNLNMDGDFNKGGSLKDGFKFKMDADFNKGGSLKDGFSFSERWAGPAYSNSPPPSSLPIPKFSMRPKRTVSLYLPSSASDIDLRPFAKSAPASPTRERSPLPDDFLENADFATKTLRRILNLDISDE